MAKKKVTEQPSEGYRLLGLELENFKNLDKKKIDIGGHSLMIIGRNGSGKSSLIQALMSPLNSKMLPSEPIKKGEERAKVSVVIGGQMHGAYNEYILDMYFTPKDNTGRLVVTNMAGEKVKSPATFIKSLIGNVSFDVMGWLHQDKAKKLQTIKQLTGISQELDGIDLQISQKKESKKYKKQRADDLEAIVQNNGLSAEEIELYSNKVDIVPMQAEMSQIAKKQSDYDGVAMKVQQFHSQVESLEKGIEGKKAQIQALLNEIESMNHEIASIQENINKGNEWLSRTQRPTVDGLNERINDAIRHNEKCDQLERIASHQREMIKTKEDINQLDIEIKILEDKKSSVIASSTFKVPGLTFSDNDIFLDGIPLEEGQVNTAKLIDVGVEVAMALNPNLKVIFLHDGSMFDKESLRNVIEKIEERGYMAVIEMVDFDGGDLDIKFTEDYLK